MNDLKPIFLVTNTISLNTIIDFDLPKKIFAVDGGANYLYQNNIIPDIIFGDLDSISRKAKEFFRGKTKFLTFKKDKNETDTELCLRYCADNNYSPITIFNSLSERFDHTLGLISNLEYALNIGLFATLENNDTKVILINKSYKFQGKINQTVSLIPFSKQVDGIYTKGLKFRLANETLYRNQTRGISNVLTKKQVEINLTKGKLLIILMKGN